MELYNFFRISKIRTRAVLEMEKCVSLLIASVDDTIVCVRLLNVITESALING